MGKWNDLQEQVREGKERNKVRKENLGKFFYDLAKLTFAGVVIGGIIMLYGEPEMVTHWTRVVSGLIGTGMIAFFANRMFK
ncbi:DUF6722 family protein [Parabacteroides sp.]